MDMNKILFELELEISNQRTNDWRRPDYLEMYCGGLQYAINRIKEEMKMIKVLNNPNVTANFKLDEFKCKCGCESVILEYGDVLLLQVLRDHFDKPIKILSGYRCEKHNKEVGGAQQSQHLLGKAYDIKVSDVHPEDVARIAVQVGFMGVGVYANNGNMFTHVDTREKRTLWRDQKGTHELLKVSSPYMWR